MLKPKDRDKVIEFLKENAETAATARHPEEHKRYRVFHDFAREVRTRYPLYSFAMQSYNRIDHALFNSTVSHKLIPENLFKKLLDL